MSVRVVKNKPYIDGLTASTATIEGVSQLSGVRVNPYDEQQAEMMNNGAGITVEMTETDGNTVVNMPQNAWTSVYGINYSLGDGTARSVVMNASGAGTVEVRKSLDGETIATIEISGNEFEEVTAELTEELTGIINNVYFVCTNGSVKVDNWRFSSEATGLKGDVNGDGVVNGTDIQAVINFIVAGEFDEKADVNKDGLVNGTDIQEIINIIVNAQ